MDLSTLANKDLLVKGVLNNCIARVETNKDTGDLEAKGNPSEQGLIRYLLKNNIPVVDIFATKETEFEG